VKGVGEKTARTLVTTYSSITALLDDTAAQTPRLAAALEGARDYLRAMEAVVPVRTDVEVTQRPGERDDRRLELLGEQHRLTNPIGRLREALDA
jgi:5'-3' exonuclease